MFGHELNFTDTGLMLCIGLDNNKLGRYVKEPSRDQNKIDALTVPFKA